MLRGRQNVIGAISDNTLFATRSFNSSIDSDIFFLWSTEAVIPEVPEKSIVGMDNTSFHKRTAMKEALLVRGHILFFLSLPLPLPLLPYFPDLNPLSINGIKLTFIVANFIILLLSLLIISYNGKLF